MLKKKKKYIPGRRKFFLLETNRHAASPGRMLSSKQVTLKKDKDIQKQSSVYNGIKVWNTQPSALTPRAKADRRAGWPAQSCPPHCGISRCTLARKSRALAFLPGRRQRVMARGRTPAWDVGLSAAQWPPALVYTEIYTSDVFSFL